MNLPGEVVLVGAGPGAPDLITVRGREQLVRADVVVYDALVSPELLDACKPEAELVYVGKRGGKTSWKQERIQELLLDRAEKGKTIVRLKGGDPLLFGRGGEELEFLAAHGIPVEVVPGVTAASGAAAMALLPLTHREVASEIAFVTGREDPGKESSGIDWSSLAHWSGTLVFYMGRSQWQRIAGRLLSEGMAATTPVLAVASATTPQEQTVEGTLGSPETLLEQLDPELPVLFLVGGVVKKRSAGRHGTRPLHGRRVLVTRTAELNSRMGRELRKLGASVISFPTIKIEPPESWAALDDAIRRLRTYDFVVFTSLHGVRAFFSRLDAAGSDARSLASAKVVAIGTATASELRKRGVRADWIPPGGTSMSLADDWPTVWPLQGAKILLPRSSLADELLPRKLAARGAEVLQVEAYRTVRADVSYARRQALLASDPPDAIVFTSSSTVRFFLELCPRAWFSGKSAVVCLGPITAEAAKKAGLRVDLVPASPSTRSLLAALEDFFSVRELVKETA